MSVHSKVRILVVLAGVLFVARLAAADGVDDLVAPGAQVKKLAGGFVFTEGPAADAEGNVFFSDIPNNRILKWSIDGKLTTFRENSGGANGLFFDKKGNLLACEGGARRLTSISMSGAIEILAERFEGKKFNSPNDLWIDPQGGVYFTDPRYGQENDLELGGFYVFYLSPDRKSLTKVIDDLVKPNGVIGTSDGKKLYVADNGGRKCFQYTIEAPGKLTGKTLFAEQGSDGLTLDERGNLYLTNNRNAVVVYNSRGEKLGEIRVPEGPANVTFGGKDKKTLFITAQTSLYSIDMQVKGQ